MPIALKTVDSSTYSPRGRGERRSSPELRCGKEYSARWAMGARTLKELDPAFSEWVERTESKKSMTAAVVMVTLFLTGVVVGAVLAGVLSGFFYG